MSMDALIGFAMATVILLALPGPTNALLMAAGSERRPGWRLIAVEILAYALAISPLLVFGELLGAWRDIGGLALKTIAVVMILWLAWRLWRRAGRNGGATLVTPSAIFWVTLFNPKSLIFAFAIFPPVMGAADVSAKVGLFVVIAFAAGSGWLSLGAMLAKTGLRRADLIGRLSAVILCGFAVYLGSSVVAGAAPWIR